MPNLTEDQRRQLLDDLDNGTNAFGPLPFAIRARLCAAVNGPTQETWDDAYSIILEGAGFTTVWQALLEHTDYAVTSRPHGEDWPAVPTQEQLLTALNRATRGEE